MLYAEDPFDTDSRRSGYHCWFLRGKNRVYPPVRWWSHEAVDLSLVPKVPLSEVLKFMALVLSRGARSGAHARFLLVDSGFPWCVPALSGTPAAHGEGHAGRAGQRLLPEEASARHPCEAPEDCHREDEGVGRVGELVQFHGDIPSSDPPTPGHSQLR